MKNSETAAWRKEKARINRFIYKWVTPLGLGWWKVDIDFCDGPPEDMGGGFEETARCHVRWPYRKAKVEFWLNSTMHLDDEALEEVVVHELCHILVNQMREKGIVHEEAVVAALSQAFLWTYSAGRKTLARPPRQRRRKK
jgi:hypothetical protein